MKYLCWHRWLWWSYSNIITLLRFLRWLVSCLFFLLLILFLNRCLQLLFAWNLLSQLLLHEPFLVLLNLALLDIFVRFKRGLRGQNWNWLKVLIVDLYLLEGFAIEDVLVVNRLRTFVGKVLVPLGVLRVSLLLFVFVSRLIHVIFGFFILWDLDLMLFQRLPLVTHLFF